MTDNPALDRDVSTKFDEMDAATRFGHLFHLIGDAVVDFEIVDFEPIVRTVNPAFEELFGYDRQAIVGKSLNDFIIPDSEDTNSSTFDQRTAAGKENTAIVRRKTASGIREFLYRGIPYEGEDGRRFGFAIYSDITDQRRYERHSQVVHRILRHNIRNELAVITATATRLRSLSDDPEIRDAATHITHHADRIVSISEETQTLQAVLGENQQRLELDVRRECEGAIETATSREETNVTLDAPETVFVEGIPQLRRAIGALLDNAVSHGTPPISVRITETTDNVLVDVIDSGDGIPEHERAPVFQDRETTPLEHGSGIGLWLARWTAEACGGELAYERTDSGQTVVRMVLVRSDETL